MLVLEPDLERALTQAAGATGDTLAIEPGLAENMMRELTSAAQRMDTLGQPPALLVPDRLRVALARLARRAAPRLKVDRPRRSSRSLHHPRRRRCLARAALAAGLTIFQPSTTNHRKAA